ncbi:MAG: hypothetical protein MUC63_05840 [Planctomycetes bacterium]|nr:hypothetical protein [Planctomycetota bacterium]
MAESTGVESRVREVLAKALGKDWAKARIVPAEKGAFKGFLAVGPGAAAFVRDRFGRLEPEPEIPFAGAEGAKAKKGIFGWELAVKVGGKEVRFARFGEADAVELAARWGGGGERRHAAPDSAAPEGVKPVPKEALEAFRRRRSGRKSSEVPQAPVVPEAEPRGPSRAVPARSADGAHAQPPARVEAPERAALLRSLSARPRLSAAAEELLRQLAHGEGLDPSPQEAADLLIAYGGAPAGQPHALSAARFGLKLAGPLAALLEHPGASREARLLAARALGEFQTRRLLPFLIHRANRESDPDVAGALFDEIVSLGGDEAERCLLQTAGDPSSPAAAAALDSLDRARWVRAVPAIAERVGDSEGDWARRARAACARILRIPAKPGEESPLSDRALSKAFAAFWKDHGVRDPSDLLRRAVEANLNALQSGKGDGRACEENLLALTRGPEGAADPAGPTASRISAWLAWWVLVRGDPAEKWAAPAVAKELEAEGDAQGKKRGRGGKKGR